jgi:hypothetical protein
LRSAEAAMRCHCAANSSRVSFLSVIVIVIVIGVPVIVRMNDPVSVLVRMTMFEVSRLLHDLLGLGNLGFGRLQPCACPEKPLRSLERGARCLIPAPIDRFKASSPIPSPIMLKLRKFATEA